LTPENAWKSLYLHVGAVASGCEKKQFSGA
jgi:hypothetical protein